MRRSGEPNRRWSRIAAVAAAGSVLLTACGTSTSSASSASAKPQYGGILKVATNADPGSLDPNVSSAFASWYVTQLVYGSLLQKNSKGQIEPNDASSYSHPNPTTYSFTIRNGLKFSNGTAVTAADIKYSFERILNPATASPWAAEFSVISSIDTPTPSTVVFNLKSPFAPFLSLVAFAPYTPIISPTEVSTYGSLKTHALGTGPFTLINYTPNVSITLGRNQFYWQKGLPYLSGIQMSVVPNSSARLAEIKSGTINLTWSQNPRITQLIPKSSGVRVFFPTKYDNELGLAFNQTTAPFNNVNVRRAVSEGINRPALIKLVLNGHGAIGSKIPPGEVPYGYAGPASGLPYNTYNPTNAKLLLQKAGYPNGFTANLNIPSIYPETIEAATLMKGQLARIGITVNIVEKDATTSLLNYIHTTYSGMSMNPLVWQPDPDVNAYNVLYSGSKINLGKFNSPTVDQLLVQGRTEQSVSARVKTYIALQKYVAQQAYMVFPYVTSAYAQLTSPNVHGFKPESSGLHLRALLQTWLSKAS